MQELAYLHDLLVAGSEELRARIDRLSRHSLYKLTASARPFGAVTKLGRWITISSHRLLFALQSTLPISAVVPLCLEDIAGIRAHVCLHLEAM
jgi:hypothetical protein